MSLFEVISAAGVLYRCVGGLENLRLLHFAGDLLPDQKGAIKTKKGVRPGFFNLIALQPATFAHLWLIREARRHALTLMHKDERLAPQRT